MQWQFWHLVWQIGANKQLLFLSFLSISSFSCTSFSFSSSCLFSLFSLFNSSVCKASFIVFPPAFCKRRNNKRRSRRKIFNLKDNGFKKTIIFTFSQLISKQTSWPSWEWSSSQQMLNHLQSQLLTFQLSNNQTTGQQAGETCRNTDLHSYWPRPVELSDPQMVPQTAGHLGNLDPCIFALFAEKVSMTQKTWTLVATKQTS